MSIYKNYSDAQLNELKENFLVDSWSYSSLSTFARNEKAFEMSQIYGQRGKSSSTTVAGQAYHFALDRYFKAKQSADEFDLASLEKFAFDYIEEYKNPFWKIQKTTPTVEECKIKAIKTVTVLLQNFFKEKSIYEDSIKNVLDVEVYCDEWLVINGVDIPMPCHSRIDLVIETHDGKVVIIDHKSKSVISDEADARLIMGKQAITYVNAYESKTGLEVHEVWMMENKHSNNKNGDKQIAKFPLIVTTDSRKLYEALLYEPLKKMITAVSDPDYVYMINESDNYVDKAEIFDFWAKTMIAEVEDFNVPDSKKEMISRRLRKIRDVSMATINPKIIKQFKENASQFIQYDLSNKNMSQQEKIEHILRTFGITVRVAHTFSGYSSNSYLLEVSAGVKVTSIQSRRLDIANALDVANVRVSKDLVVNGGKSYVAVESTRERDNTLLWNESDLVDMKLPIGKDNFGNTIVWDLNNHSTPHLLVGGATGSGKSVCIKSTIMYAQKAGVKQIYILDPKHEFIHLGKSNVTVLNEIEDIEATMELLVETMNHKVKNGLTDKVLIIFDEFADALANSRRGKALQGDKSLEENLRLLLQKGRSSGFRIMAGTQRASTKIISGDAKVNFPVQICFRVPKESDSRVMLDESGAEALSGMGDGLIKSPQYNDTVRFQGYYAG